MIIPALLEKDIEKLKDKIEILSSHFNRFHLDIIDESYGNKTVSLGGLPKFKDEAFWEAHLMIDEPEKEVKKLKNKNTDLVFGQVERVKNLDKFLKECEVFGIEPGICIDLDSEIEKYKKEIMRIRRFVLMAVRAGKSGQEFDERVLNKIKKLREYCGESAEILIDGGINKETARMCFKNGANGVLVNSYLWEDFENNLYQLRLVDK